MSFNFVIPEFHIGSGDGVPTIQMFRSGFRLGGSATPSWKDVVISGIGALTLVNAKADGLNYLKLFGDTEQLPETYLDTVTLSGGCEQSGTPSPTTPIDIVCNNGAIKYGKPITLDSTRYYAYIATNGIYTYSDDSYSIIIPVEVGQKYKITADPTTPIGDLPNIILRWGFIDNLPPDTWKESTSTAPSPSSMTINDWVRTTPQDTSTEEVTATHPYLVIQMGAGVFADNIANGRISVTEQSIYTDGTVETVTDSNGLTASAQMLLSVGTYKDTQEILTGAVTRNIGIKVLDGSENWSYTDTSRFSTYFSDGRAEDNQNLAYCSHFAYIKSATYPTTNMYFSLNKSGSQCRFSLYYTAYTSVNAFKQWLADQYNAGTPVIVVYPTSSATTESVTPQLLLKSPVTQTAGSISNLPIAITESSHTTPTPQQPLQINCNNGVVKVSPNVAVLSSNTMGSNITNIDITTGTFNVNVGISNTSSQITSRLTTLCPNLKEGDTVYFHFNSEPTGNMYLGGYGTGILINSDSSLTITSTLLSTQLRIGGGDPSTGRTFAITNFYIGKEPYSSFSSYPAYGSIYVDGTTETVEVTGKNLFDKSTADANRIYAYIQNTGTQWAWAELGFSVRIPCKPNTTYTARYNGSETQAVLSFGSTDNDTLPTQEQTFVPVTQAIRQNNPTINTPITITTGANDKWLIVAYNIAEPQHSDMANNLQVEQSSTATTYEPYYSGGSLECPMLLSVGS